MACQCDHLSAGIKVVINSTVHRVQDIWDKSLTTQDWGSLPVDAKNVFNDINRVGMLWTVWHLWPYVP